MQQPASTLATLWQIILRLIEKQGLDAEQFSRELGISAEVLRDPTARLPSRLTDRAFAKAEAVLANPAFALRAAECWHPSNLGIIGFAWLSSRTLHTGLKRMERFSRILGSRFSYRCAMEERGLRFVYDHGRGDWDVGHAMTDFSLSILVDMCRTNIGHRLEPLEVTLRRPQPADTSPWRVFFGCKVRFGADEDSFLLDGETANAPLPTVNVPLANTFDAILTEQLATVFNDDIVSRCKAFLLRELTSGEPSAAALALALCMSQRSLQRRLAALGLTFQGILDETRHELARRYLDDSSKSVTEITFLLGFSEQSAFTRAFRRWSGMSPTGYRENGVFAH
ncbi:AraC family transcriptional regulator [uncultured Propionivibrio sp.]|uniref:AraC family transcriptional regulator n=1 Tax=uncultured Propionivibrio sp. TaxID=426737 RepID=UPI0029C0C054|nr:AraC family transcriptional regulator [uncultured Propionivibrio sp.]